MFKRSALVSFVALAGLALATPAAAQFGGIKIGGKKGISIGGSKKKDDKAQRKLLSEVNSMSQKGARKVPGN